MPCQCLLGRGKPWLKLVDKLSNYELVPNKAGFKAVYIQVCVVAHALTVYSL